MGADHQLPHTFTTKQGGSVKKKCEGMCSLGSGTAGMRMLAIESQIRSANQMRLNDGKRALLSTRTSRHSFPGTEWQRMPSVSQHAHAPQSWVVSLGTVSAAP